MAIRNVVFYTSGLVFLTLSKLKNLLRGYSTPKPFSISETERCAAYDIKVVDQWLLFLKEYIYRDNFIKGKNILELGPGSDLGVGLYLLSLGAAQYHACDVNDLVQRAPNNFYDFFFEKLAALNNYADVNELRMEFREMQAGRHSRLNYILRNDFDLEAAFGKEMFDLVFSQAAFEHFDNVGKTVAHLSAVCKPGAVLVAVIDMQTHSRWIRAKDPNNIYRYSDGVYNLFWFRGIPNRLRPYQYKEIFERFGWIDVSVLPLSRLDPAHGGGSGLNQAFTNDWSQMDFLSIVLCARKL
jgi:SAM-dependent methyltransferase